MTAPKLSPRLAAVKSFVRRDKIICDVGTDHALLPCSLYLDGAREIIASDINDGPLLSAKETVRRYIGNETAITLVKSDGLDNIPFAEEIIVAGMGGELIARIVCGCGFLSADTHFILQPMTKAEILRTELYANGFDITEECAVKDSGRLYAVMSVNYSGVKKEISPAFSYTGLITDKEYLQKQADALFAAANACKSSCSEKAERLFSVAQQIKQKTI